MKAQEIIDKFESFIGEGKRFKTRAEAARYLGLPISQATRFFDFLDGKDTRYMSVLDWLEKMGGLVTFPDDSANLPAIIPPRIDSLPVAVDRIAQLERALDAKDQQLAELIQYKYKWEGLVEIKRLEADAREREQKSLTNDEKL